MSSETWYDEQQWPWEAKFRDVGEGRMHFVDEGEVELRGDDRLHLAGDPVRLADLLDLLLDGGRRHDVGVGEVHDRPPQGAVAEVFGTLPVVVAVIFTASKST